MHQHIAYYITAHGFGHAVRSLEVIRELRRSAPQVAITIVSTIPAFLITQNLDAPLPQRGQSLDVGMVQLDSLRMDFDATLRELDALKHRQQELIAEEVSFFRRAEITAVIADIPFLAFVAASHYGIPSVGLGNFTWDWVYAYYAAEDERWKGSAHWAREAYGLCELFLQLPMNGDCSACPRILPVPLVARKARRGRGEVRALLGLGEKQRAYLLSFSALEVSQEARNRVEAIADAVFLCKHPLRFDFANTCPVDDADVSYAELVAAVDGVITKPGYGIAADCLAQGTPMIYTDRGDFPEYDILVREITRWLPAVYLPSADLYEGRWQSALEQLPRRPAGVPAIATDGNQVCARAILQHIGGSG